MANRLTKTQSSNLIQAIRSKATKLYLFYTVKGKDRVNVISNDDYMTILKICDKMDKKMK